MKESQQGALLRKGIGGRLSLCIRMRNDARDELGRRLLLMSMNQSETIEQEERDVVTGSIHQQ